MTFQTGQKKWDGGSIPEKERLELLARFHTCEARDAPSKGLDFILTQISEREREREKARFGGKGEMNL